MAMREEDNSEAEEAVARRPAPRRRISLLIRWSLVLAVLVVLAATFPAHWGPAVATWGIRTFTPLGDSAGNRFTIVRLSPTRLEMADIRLGGFPMAPSCKTLSARYTLTGLCFREIESLHLEGVALDPGHSSPREGSVVVPSRGKAVPLEPGPRRAVDLLKGFAVFDLRIRDVTVDLAPLLPPRAKAALSSGRVEGSFEGGCDSPRRRIFHGTWTGRWSDGPFEGTVDYVPPYASPTSNATIRARLSSHPVLAEGIPALPGPLVVLAEASFCEGRGLETDFKVAGSWSNSVWKAEAEGHADALGFQLAARLPETSLSVEDGVIASALALAPPSAPLEALRLQATLAASATVTGLAGRLPEWQARGRLSGCSFSTRLGDRAAGVTGLVVRAGCKGIGSHLAPVPVAVSITNAYLEPFPFGRGRFQIMADREMLMMTSGSLGFCGGRVRAYALYLSFDNLRSGFTLFLDQLDVDKIVKLLPGVGGSGKGRLYGQLPLRITAKKELRLRNAFLYARPGETGNIRFEDTGPIVRKLQEYGIQPDTCETIGFALRDLDYDLLRFDLTKPRRDDGSLSIRLKGQAMEGKKPTPVELNVNLNGPIEKLLNLGIKTATIGR